MTEIHEFRLRKPKFPENTVDGASTSVAIYHLEPDGTEHGDRLEFDTVDEAIESLEELLATLTTWRNDQEMAF